FKPLGRATKHFTPSGLITSCQSGSAKYPLASISASSASLSFVKFALRAPRFLASVRSNAPSPHLQAVAFRASAPCKCVDVLFLRRLLSTADRVYRLQNPHVLLVFRVGC